MRRKVPGASTIASAVLAASVLAGCSGVQTLSFRTPPPTSRQAVAPPATFPPGLSSASERGVGGATTTTLPAIGPGNATIAGTVSGPAGPVAGATVQIDRFVGTQIASAQMTTDPGGAFSFRSVLGGRYRVRAWQAPTMALTSPQLIFVTGGQTQSIALQLTSFTGPAVAASIAPPNPVQGQRANLLLQVTGPVVGSDGVVRNPPVAGVSVALTGGPQWDVYNGNPLTTNESGEVVFQVSCQQAGADPLSAAVGSAPPTPLRVPVCAPRPVPTTTAATTTTTVAGAPTSTTCPPSASTTTLPFGNAC